MIATAPLPAEGDAGRGGGFLRRKHNIGVPTLMVLTLIGCLPLVIAFARYVVLPASGWLPDAVRAPLRALGEFMNQYCTLAWIPPQDRAAVLYLLLLPTGALFVTIARLTFGLRVLGLRAILLAIGFRAVGVLPSLALLLVVVGTIVAIRPWMRRIQLPMYARIPVILCLTVAIMVGALLVAPWLGSQWVWRLAFFPVIIMAMLAESVAKSAEQDDVVTAAWRAVWTIALALFILLVNAPASQLNYEFPELILTQLVAILFVSEFLDLRLLEEWPARLSRRFAGRSARATERPKVAVVCDPEIALAGAAPRGKDGDEGSSAGRRCVEALRDEGFAARLIAADARMLGELARFLPPNARPGARAGMVLNLAAGALGEGRSANLPALFEHAGIPHAGPSAMVHTSLTDRMVLLTLLTRSRVAVPRHCVAANEREMVDLSFPVAVVPRFAPQVDRVIAHDSTTLQQAIADVRATHRQPALVEEVIAGRRFSVAVLGDATPECLTLVESLLAEDRKQCPAEVGDDLADRIRACGLAAYRALGCRDYARIDVRLSTFDEPVVVDVRWTGIFARRGSFLTAASKSGMPLGSLLRRILASAAGRHRELAMTHSASAHLIARKPRKAAKPKKAKRSTQPARSAQAGEP